MYSSFIFHFIANLFYYIIFCFTLHCNVRCCNTTRPVPDGTLLYLQACRLLGDGPWVGCLGRPAQNRLALQTSAPRTRQESLQRSPGGPWTASRQQLPSTPNSGLNRLQGDCTMLHQAGDPSGLQGSRHLKLQQAPLRAGQQQQQHVTWQTVCQSRLQAGGCLISRTPLRASASGLLLTVPEVDMFCHSIWRPGQAMQGSSQRYLVALRDSTGSRQCQQTMTAVFLSDEGLCPQ